MKTTSTIKPTLSINAFGKDRFFLGLSIFAFSTTIAYGFLFFLRELFIILSIDFHFPNQAWELDTTQIIFYDFILALLALQIGQMVFFEFCLSKPTLLPHWNFRKRTILIDNRNLLPNFLFFGLKMGMTIGLFFSYEMMIDMFHVNGLIFWILMLTITTLHLQAWTTIIRTFKKANNWMASTFGIMILLAVFMSQIHPIDYLKINNLRLQKVPDYHLKITPPTAKINQIPKFSFRHIDFTLQYKNGKIQLADQFKVIEWSDIPFIIEKAKKYTPSYAQAQLFASATIDKNVPMEFVFKLKQSLRSNGINKISYTILPSDFEFKSVYPFDRQYGLIDKMLLTCENEKLEEGLSFLKKAEKLNGSEFDIGCDPFSFMWEGVAFSLQDNTTVYLNKKGNTYIDNKLIKQEYLIPAFEKIFQEPELVELFFEIDKKAKYNQYIQLKVAIWQARINILNQACEKQYGHTYSEDLPIAKRRAIKAKYPISILEPNSKVEYDIYKELERIGGSK